MLRLILALTCLQAAQAAEPFFNLGFEAVRGSHPRIWRSWGNGFETTVDNQVPHSGKASLRIECRGLCLGSGVAVQCLGGTGSACIPTFPLEVFRGKRIRYSGYVKTERVTKGYAGLRWEVTGNEGRLAYDDMHESGARGTTPWTRYVIDQQVDANATEVEFGVHLAGNGTAWFDSLQIEIDGKIYPQPPPPVPPEPTAQETNWVKKNAITFDTDQAGRGFSDLQPLKRLIGTTRIIGLGEQTHGTSEFQRMKHRLTEFLASEMGFTAFAIEASMPEAYALNNYVLNGVGDPKHLLFGLGDWTWYTQEVLDMVMWMREFNQSGKGHIEFWGLDMRKPGVALANVSKFLDAADAEYSATAYRGLSAALLQLNPSQTAKDTGLRVASEVLDHMRSNRDVYMMNRKATDVDWAIQNARIVLQAATFKWGIEDGAKVRDRAMADNVEWILEHSPGTKIVVWEHNDHIAKEPDQLGGYLSVRHLANYKTFGFAFHEGRYNANAGNGRSAWDASISYPGSVEYVLHQSGIPRFILDLHAATGKPGAWLTQGLDWRNIGSARGDGFGPNARLSSQFDALIFFDRTTPTHLLPIPTRPAP